MLIEHSVATLSSAYTVDERRSLCELGVASFCAVQNDGFKKKLNLNHRAPVVLCTVLCLACGTHLFLFRVSKIYNDAMYIGKTPGYGNTRFHPHHAGA